MQTRRVWGKWIGRAWSSRAVNHEVNSSLGAGTPAGVTRVATGGDRWCATDGARVYCEVIRKWHEDGRKQTAQ